MLRRPPRSTLTDTLFPYTTLFRSTVLEEEVAREVGRAGGAAKDAGLGQGLQTRRDTIDPGLDAVDEFAVELALQIGGNRAATVDDLLQRLAAIVDVDMHLRETLTARRHCDAQPDFVIAGREPRQIGRAHV